MAHIGFVSTSVLESKDGVSAHVAKIVVLRREMQPFFPPCLVEPAKTNVRVLDGRLQREGRQEQEYRPLGWALEGIDAAAAAAAEAVAGLLPPGDPKHAGIFCVTPIYDGGAI